MTTNHDTHLTIFELKPSPSCGQKSFYKKAWVHQSEYQYRLQSYDTTAAIYDKRDKTILIKGYYSATTARHINAFLKFVGRNERLTKKEIEAAAALGEYI